ncbi:MAG: ABC transporter ATP-binding protein [Clostridiales bacterium]|nr:ABC transporter ATP-binding protein [Clostridiales bacterium]
MFKVLKNLKQSWITILIIVLLLCVQAMADLNLPDYTSKIVNIGIQQGGIENSTPKVITKETMEKILLVTKEDELILNNYEIFSKGNFDEKEYKKIIEEYKNIEMQECYILKEVDEQTQDTLNLEIGKAIMTVSMLEEPTTAEQMKQEIILHVNNLAKNQGGEINDNVNFEKYLDKDLFEIAKGMPNEQLEAIIDIINLKYNEMQSSIIEQSAINHIKVEYEKLGVDLERKQMNYILWAGIQMLGIALVSMISACIIALLSAKVAAKIGKTLRENVYKKVLSFSNVEHKKFGASSLITRNTNDVQQIQNLVPMLFRVVIYAPIIGIGAFIKVLNTSENSMAWIIGLAILVIVLVIGTLFMATMPKFKKLQDLIDKLNMVSREILTGLPVIRAFNKEKYEEEKFDKANKDLMKVNLFVNRSMSFMMPLLMFIMNSINLLIIWVGAFKVDEGIMQVGNLMVFMQYAMQIVISFLFISMLSIILPRSAVSAKRITEVLNTEVNVKDSENVKKFNKKVNGLVEFKDVSFRYPDADTEILTDISFTANPGEVTAIIGSTGSGKSTIVNLIPRLYDVTAGEILIDGLNIKEVSQKDLRDIIGFVPQKGVLFSGTIESNIKYSNKLMLDEKMINAAKISQSEDFINSKVDKYKSEISQGGNNVSGGQKQRLSIARAIAKEPEIFIFDDSFSALDFKTDYKLREALQEVTENKTVIIVAQRINTIINANKIIVLDEGKIVGMGTHEQLLQNNEVYKQIALSQLSKEELNNDTK